MDETTRSEQEAVDTRRLAVKIGLKDGIMVVATAHMALLVEQWWRRQPTTRNRARLNMRLARDSAL